MKNKRYNKSRTGTPVREHKGNKRGLAISQIIIILLGTIAFSYMLGSDIGFVSAASNECTITGKIGPTNTGVIKETSTFCYGDGTSTVPYRVYTVINASHITRYSDGAQYSKHSDGSWYYGTQILGGTKDNQKNFANAAAAALVNLNAQNAAKAATPAATTKTTTIPPAVTNAAPVNNPVTDISTMLSQGGSDNCLTIAIGLGMDPGMASLTCSLIFPSNIPAAPSMEPGGAGTAPQTTGEHPSGGSTLSGTGTMEPGGAGTAPQTTGEGPKSPYDLAAEKITDFLNGGGGAAGATTAVIPVHSFLAATLNIFAAASAAASVYAAFGWVKASFLADFFKANPGWGFAYAAAQAAATGFTAAAVAAPTLAAIFGTTSISAFGFGLIGTVLGLALFLITYREAKIDAVVFSCIPWQAPAGGADCGKCGQNGLPCTAYQCASLGTGCEMLNTEAGEGKPICTWVDEKDTAAPTISFLGDILPEGYTYEPSNPPAEYPKDTGVLIKYNGGDIPPYTSLLLGVANDKVSKCKIDYTRGDNISEMGNPMQGGVNGNEGLWGKNHTLNVPIFQQATGNVSIQQSGEVNLYVRCESRNGYSDVNAFVIQFNVEQTPDQTAPEIRGTDILNGAPIAMGTSDLDVHVYVNEPVSGCKWSPNNYDYANMENSMTCPNVMNPQGSFAGTFPCTAHLNGLNDNGANNFYFLCNDTAGNVATEDSINPFVLIGTQALAIISVSPADGTIIKDSTDSVKVTLTAETAGGFSQGQSICSYSDTGTTGSYKQFDTNSYQHSVSINLPAGSYNYHIKCIDAGGNADEKTASFSVETDTSAPLVVRASHENANLNIKTNEEAKCVYDIIDCNYPFEDGISMSTSDGMTHSAGWVGGRTYYIKCNDLFGNKPAQDVCTAILSSSQI